MAALGAQEEVFITRAKQANAPRNAIWPQGRRHLDSTGYSRGGAETLKPPTNSAPSVCIYLEAIQIAMFRPQAESRTQDATFLNLPRLSRDQGNKGPVKIVTQ